MMADPLGSTDQDRRTRLALWVAAAGACALSIQFLLVHLLSFGSPSRLPVIVQIIATAVVIRLALRGRADRSSIMVVSALWLIASFTTLLEFSQFTIRIWGSLPFVASWFWSPTAELVIVISCLLNLWWTRGARPNEARPESSAPHDSVTVSLWVVALGVAVGLAGLVPTLGNLVSFTHGRELKLALFIDSARLPFIIGCVVYAGLRGKAVNGALWILVATTAAGFVYLMSLLPSPANFRFTTLLPELVADLLVLGGGLAYLRTMAGRQRREPERPTAPLATDLAPS